MSIEIKGLTKKFGRQVAVNSVSFSVQQGEIAGFLGPNGAGKSTTMKVLTTYLPPDEGEVRVYGHDVTLQPQQVRRITGYLPEHNPLYLDMYIKEYLPFIGSLYGLKGRKLSDRVKEMIDMTGLESEQHKKLGALSKGYRQRVGLAQALIHDPKVLILDEPTTGLDPNQIIEIRNLIRQISREKIVILSTHIMQEVQALCDRAIIINQGSIVADGKVSELQAGNREGYWLVMEFSEEVTPEILQPLQFEEVTSTDNQILKIWIKGKEDKRSEIFRLAGEKNWPLIGLTKEEHSMEKIFQELTRSSK